MSNQHSFDAHNLPLVDIAFADQASVNGSWRRPFGGGDSGDRVVYILFVGTIAAEEIDMILQQATDSAGAGAKAITGAAITQLVAADDDVIVTIDIGPGALDDAGGFEWVQAQVVVDNSAAEPLGVIYNVYRLRNPGLAAQDASYAEQIRVYD